MGRLWGAEAEAAQPAQEAPVNGSSSGSTVSDRGEPAAVSEMAAPHTAASHSAGQESASRPTAQQQPVMVQQAGVVGGGTDAEQQQAEGAAGRHQDCLQGQAELPAPAVCGSSKQRSSSQEGSATATAAAAAGSRVPLHRPADAAANSQAGSQAAAEAPAEAASADSGQAAAVSQHPPQQQAALEQPAKEGASQVRTPQEAAAELPSSRSRRPAADDSAQAEAAWQQCSPDVCAAAAAAAATAAAAAAVLPTAAAPPPAQQPGSGSSGHPGGSRPLSAAEGSVCSEGSSAHSSLSEASTWSVPEKPSVYGLPYNFGHNALMFQWQDPSELAGWPGHLLGGPMVGWWPACMG